MSAPVLFLPPCWPRGVVRANQAWAGEQACQPTGHGALDAALFGGWPCGAMVEVIQVQPAFWVWQLVGPALAFWCARAPSPGEPARSQVVLVAPPHPPLAQALQARGIRTDAMLWLDVADPVQRLWACEQALQCHSVGAVLAWLPQAPMVALRRLQHAATRHGGLFWAFRPWQAQHQPSPAPLRLRLDASTPDGGAQARVLKWRGSLPAQPLALQSTDLALQQALAGARWRSAQRRNLQAALPGVHVHDDHEIPVAGPELQPA